MSVFHSLTSTCFAEPSGRYIACFEHGLQLRKLKKKIHVRGTDKFFFQLKFAVNRRIICFKYSLGGHVLIVRIFMSVAVHSERASQRSCSTRTLHYHKWKTELARLYPEMQDVHVYRLLVLVSFKWLLCIGDCAHSAILKLCAGTRKCRLSVALRLQSCGATRSSQSAAAAAAVN